MVIEDWQQPFVGVSSEMDCHTPYMEWEDPVLEALTTGEALLEQRSPWPRMVYFGPASWSAIAQMTPVLHGVGYVYHLLDAWHRVLYVGKSYRPATRIQKHRGKEWWPKVYYVRIFSSMEYDLLELADIEALAPLYNKWIEGVTLRNATHSVFEA